MTNSNDEFEILGWVVVILGLLVTAISYFDLETVPDLLAKKIALRWLRFCDVFFLQGAGCQSSLVSALVTPY